MNGQPDPQVASESSRKTSANRDILDAAKGSGIIFSGKMFTFANRFVIAILLARLLGAEQYGLYNLALTAITVGSGLTLLGLRDTTVRYVSLFASRKDEVGLWGVIQVTLGLTFILSVMAGIGLYLLADPIAQQIFKEPQLGPLLRLSSLIIPLFTLIEILAAATRGFKNMKYTTISQDIVQPLLRLVLVIIISFIGLTAARMIEIYSFTLLITFLLLLYFLNKQFPLKRPLHQARYETKELLKFSTPIYFSDLIGSFGGNIKTILLGVFSTVADVGIFAIASQVNKIGKVFHLAIVTTSMPVVSALYDQGKQDELGRFYQTMTKWTFTLNFPFFLVILLFPEKILNIFGTSFISGAPALIILAWANLINMGTGICGVLLDMSGNTTLKLINSIVTVTLNIGLNILLIPTWGLIGAAIAALAANVIVNLLRLGEVFFLLRLQPYSLNFLKPIFAGGIAMAIVLFIIESFTTSANDLVVIIVNVSVLLITYTGLLLLFGLSQEDRMVLSRLKRRTGSIFSRRKK